MKTTKILVIAVATLIASNSFAASKQYRLTGAPNTGSKLRVVDATAPVSFNKRYVELSNEEQALFNKQFSGLSANDRPPFPARGLRSIYRPILEKNKSIPSQGMLHLSVAVDKDGNVETVRVISSPSEKLEQYASQMIKNVEFEAASCNGESCAMDFPVKLELQ